MKWDLKLSAKCFTVYEKLILKSTLQQELMRTDSVCNQFDTRITNGNRLASSFYTSFWKAFQFFFIEAGVIFQHWFSISFIIICVLFEDRFRLISECNLVCSEHCQFWLNFQSYWMCDALIFLVGINKIPCYSVC